MQCPACAAENDPSSKFCMACGSALPAAEPATEVLTAVPSEDAPAEPSADDAVTAWASPANDDALASDETMPRVDRPSWLDEPANVPGAEGDALGSDAAEAPAATEAELEGAPVDAEAGADAVPVDATPPPWTPSADATPAPHHEAEPPPPPAGFPPAPAGPAPAAPSGYPPPPAPSAYPPPPAAPAAYAPPPPPGPAGFPPPPGQGYAPSAPPPPPNPGAWTPPAPGWTQNPPPPPAPAAPAPPQGYAPPPPPSGYPPPPAPQAYGQAPPPPAPPAPQGYGQAPPPPPQAQSAWGQPAPGAYAPPAAFAPPPPPGPAGAPDPNGLGLAFGRLSSGARKTAKTAVTVAGALLDEGETVEAVVAGRIEGHGAVVVLSDRTLRLVDEREWRPLNEVIPLGPGLEVQGWQDDRTASLTFVFGGRSLVLDQIPDRELAVEMAGRIRYRAGATG